MKKIRSLSLSALLAIAMSSGACNQGSNSSSAEGKPTDPELTTGAGTGTVTGADTGTSTGSGGSPAVSSGRTTGAGGSAAAGGGTGTAAVPPMAAVDTGSGASKSGSAGSTPVEGAVAVPSDPAMVSPPPVAEVGTAKASSTSTSTSVAISPPTQTGGLLSAGTWDDNLNFSFYQSYLATTVATQMAGLPLIDRSARMVILVNTVDGLPAAGVLVSVVDSAGHLFSSTTGAEGRVLYFPGLVSVPTGTTVTITASLEGDTVSQVATATAGTLTLRLAQTPHAAVAALDLAFVLDTTGSMSDELAYIQSELDHIVGGITTQFPGIPQRFALVMYRDTGDDYVVRKFDFVSDLATFRQNLAAQSADGGGDFPEAVDQGLAAAAQLSWQAGAAARVAFWIADAPPHVGREGAVVSALEVAATKGIHIYPVAASGIDDLGEFTMRTAAEVTGGRYLFLTNDSGIGGSHQEPHIPCYYVTTLESAMRRMIATELTGTYAAPTPAEIIRTSGDPQSQQCTLTGGGVVSVW